MTGVDRIVAARMRLLSERLLDYGRITLSDSSLAQDGKPVDDEYRKMMDEWLALAVEYPDAAEYATSVRLAQLAELTDLNAGEWREMIANAVEDAENAP